MSTVVRVVVLIVLLSVGWIAWWGIHAGYECRGVVPPPGDVETFPREVAGWKGEDTEIDERITGRLEPIKKIDRRYRKASGEEVFIHAIWTKDYVKIHFPEVCYTQNGFEQLDRKILQVRMPDGSERPMALVRFRKDAREMYVLYWFQIGDKIFLDRTSHRLLRRSECWGRSEWPPLVKGMLQTHIDDGAAAEARLREMAARVFSWINLPEQSDPPQKNAPAAPQAAASGEKKEKE